MITGWPHPGLVETGNAIGQQVRPVRALGPPGVGLRRLSAGSASEAPAGDLCELGFSHLGDGSHRVAVGSSWK